MKILKTALAAAALTLVAGAASAATVHLNVHRGWDTGSNSYTGSDGTSVTLYGVQHNNGHIYDAHSTATASWGGYYGGAGVCSNMGARERSCDRHNDVAYDDPGHTVDGYGADNMLLVHFAQRVTITSLVFSYVDHNDDFEIYAYDGGVHNLTQYGWIGPNGSLGYESTGAGDFASAYASYFGIGAADYSDDWKLKAIHYEIAPVPLPAAGFMLLAGLGGLGIMRARKNRAA